MIRRSWLSALLIIIIAIVIVFCYSDMQNESKVEAPITEGQAALSAEGGDQAVELKETGFVLKEIMVDGLMRKYTVYVPPTYRPDVEWPIILFFHGSGEGGTDGVKPTTVGIGPAIQEHPERYPAIIVFPQQRPGLSVDNLWRASFEKTLEEYKIDPLRKYATGLSAGAYAVWFQGPWLIQHDFAALLPIAGGGNPSDAATLATIPIWAFHGEADETVPVSESRKMVDAIQAINGDNLKYTEFPGVGHNSWDSVYGNEEYTSWLLRQRLGSGMIE